MVPDGFASTYGIDLLCDTLPLINKHEMLAAIRMRCPAAKFFNEDSNSEILAFAHEDHPGKLGLAAQTLVTVANGAVQQELLNDALQQSWSFPEALHAVAGAQASVRVTDFMASSLQYGDRLSLFHRALASILAVVSCRAIYWEQSQRIVNPTAFLEAFKKQPPELFCAGALNVRFFNVSGGQDEFVMDTLGLAALGLPDIQCHFHGLDKAKMANFLYSLGWYIFENGDVIADGHTIDGLTPGSRWSCQHEESIVPPKRVVLDLDPGPGFAAGRRPRSERA
jgi:hypothetical protein